MARVKGCETSAKWLGIGLLTLASLSPLAGAQNGRSRARATPSRWSRVATALGAPGEIRGDDFRVEFAPLANHVRMRGVTVAPGALGPNWVTFGQQGELGWMMGRLMLPAKDGAAAAGLLARAGIQVTGVVDPLPGSTPAVSTVFFSGMGDPALLARHLKAALGARLRPRTGRNASVLAGLDVKAIEQVVGRPGELASGALVFHIPRPEIVKCCGLATDPLLVYSGVPLSPATGMESRVAFQPVGTSAAVFGRFAVRQNEAELVEQALAVFGIQTVSLSDPLSDEYPRILSLYFFGQGKPLELAQGVRSAIERIHHLPSAQTP